MRARLRAFVRSCVFARARACVCVHVRVCVFECVCVFARAYVCACECLLLPPIPSIPLKSQELVSNHPGAIARGHAVSLGM